MKLKIAVQKSGRLNEDSMKLLKDCGIKIENGNDKLKSSASNFPIEILFLRNSDIPQYLEDGVADIAILGENLLSEQQKNIIPILQLGFSKCRLSLAVPKEAEYQGLEWFQGRKIATSYPNSLTMFLKEKNIESEIHTINGSVEIAPNIGLADGICDLVSSGNTLFMNGLKEVEIILQSQAVLVASPCLNIAKEQIQKELLFRIRSVLSARKFKYVLLNCREDKVDIISSILPGMKSPTVLPLHEKGWCSMHSVVGEDDFWNSIGQLKEHGAEGILIIPIEKMIQ